MLSADLKKRLQERVDGIEKFLREDPEGLKCFGEQKHCEEGTEARAYWHLGYRRALMDLLEMEPPAGTLLS